MEKHILSDINEAVSLMETYRLTSLVWRFEDCPLDEMKVYVPKGKEELVLICYKEDKYIPFRMVFDNAMHDPEEVESNIIELSFHEEYHLFIILNPEKLEQ
jgi:hypothetical protein